MGVWKTKQEKRTAFSVVMARPGFFAFVIGID
jgi:hypothetical protein